MISVEFWLITLVSVLLLSLAAAWGNGKVPYDIVYPVLISVVIFLVYGAHKGVFGKEPAVFLVNYQS